MPKPTLRTSFMPQRPTPAFIISSDVAFGTKTVPSEEVDAAFGMPEGKLKSRAGIVSLARAEESETEVTLGARAASGALRSSGQGVEEADWIFAASETHRAFPSLAAQLHRRI